MPEPIRAGIIGCDTSHCTTFAKLFHDEKGKDHVPGVRIVAAYPSFSKDIASSADRVEGFTKQLETDFGVKITKSIDELVGQCDAFLIESVDGRRHRVELEAVAKAGKPVFVDKPFAASLADAKAMVELARQAKIPCFSASSLRFNDVFQDFLKEDKYGKVFGCDAHSPAHLEPTNPGFYWYGVHGVEILYTIMGTGCKQVACTHTEPVDVAVGLWDNDRVGTMRGMRRGKTDYGAMAYCEKGIVPLTPVKTRHLYAGLLERIAEFFRTGKAPVPIEETLETMAFIEAAWKSAQAGGDEVPLEL